MKSVQSVRPIVRRNRLNAVLERITDGFYALDKDWSVTYWNKQAEYMLGKTRKEVLGKNLWDCYPDGKALSYLPMYEKALNEQTTVRFEEYYAPFDIWNEIIVYPSEKGISVYFKNITDRKKAEKEVEVLQARMNLAVLEAQEKERAVIGRELHDNVNQVLGAVKLYNELCLSEPAQTEHLIRKSMEMLQTAIDDIRTLSGRLSPPVIARGDLKAVVEQLILDIAESKKFKIQLNADVLNGVELADELHVCIYRVLQEQLTNILKHANAKKVVVEFMRDNGYLLLRVHDDGDGFNTRASGKGIGIHNMKMRTESLDGMFDISSKPGVGTVLFIQLPFSG